MWHDRYHRTPVVLLYKGLGNLGSTTVVDGDRIRKKYKIYCMQGDFRYTNKRWSEHADDKLYTPNLRMVYKQKQRARYINFIDLLGILKTKLIV